MDEDDLIEDGVWDYYSSLVNPSHDNTFSDSLEDDEG